MNQNMLIYNALDSAVTKEIEESFWHELEMTHQEKTYDFTMHLLEPLMYMMTRGILVDRDNLLKTSEKMGIMIVEKQVELDKLCGHPLNVSSPKQCQQYFYIEKGIRPYMKGGSITTNDTAMQRIARGTAAFKGLREAKLVQEIRSLRKMKGTYVDMTFDEDGRMRCSWNPRGTRFGRLSSSKTVFDTGMNMQNLPFAFKEFLVADPGMVMIELDKRQAEWVAVAFISGDANMMKAVLEGKDPHVYTASQMFGVPEELVKMEDKIIGHETDPVRIEELRKRMPDLRGLPFLPRNMSMRQAGKKANHGLNYDEGFRTFALDNEMLEADAKKVISFYHGIYPGIRQWYSAVQNQLNKDRILKSCFGREYKFLEAWGDKLFKAAYSYNPQSTVGDLVNKGIEKTYYDTTDYMYLIELLAQVHDSVLFQYPIDQVDNLTKAIITMEEYLNPELTYHGRSFRIETDMKVGLTWGTLKEVPLSKDHNKLKTNLERVINEFGKTSE